MFRTGRTSSLYLSKIKQTRIRQTAASGWKMEMDVVFGWNGYAIAGSGTEAPVAQYGDDPLVDSVPQALEQSLLHHDPLRVDGDLHDHISLNAAGKLRARNL